MIWRGIALLACGALGGWLAYQVTNRDPPVIVYTAEAEAPVASGETLRIYYTLYRHRQCATSVDRAIIDSRNTRFTLPPLNFVTGGGPLGQDQYTSTLTIPAETSSGYASYRTTARFSCDLVSTLWPIYVPTREVRFLIVDRPKS